jgi:hypothetical protein
LACTGTGSCTDAMNGDTCTCGANGRYACVAGAGGAAG